MGVRVRYSDGSERWCESCADPNPNGGSVVQGGTEHNSSGGSLASPGAQAPNSASQGPGGNGVSGTMAGNATQADRSSNGYASFYPSTYGNGTTNGVNQPGGGSGGSGIAEGSNRNVAAPNTIPNTSPTGTPKTNQEWSFDPTQPGRTISAGMSLLGLPSYGPAADFYQRYGQAGISQSLADGSFMNPGTFQNAMTNRLQGINPDMGADSMVRSLMGGESLATSVTSGKDSQLMQYFNKDASGMWHPKPGMNAPTDLARAAYIANSESDPNGIAQLLTGALTGNGVNMSSSVSNLLGAFLGNVGTKRFNAATPQNDTMKYLGSLLGY